VPSENEGLRLSRIHIACLYLEIGLVDFLYRAKEIVNSDKA
jgi:hypothetical protein